jgi:hypothetical protein
MLVEEPKQRPTMPEVCAILERIDWKTIGGAGDAAALFVRDLPKDASALQLIDEMRGKEERVPRLKPLLLDPDVGDEARRRCFELGLPASDLALEEVAARVDLREFLAPLLERMTKSATPESVHLLLALARQQALSSEQWGSVSRNVCFRQERLWGIFPRDVPAVDAQLADVAALLLVSHLQIVTLPEIGVPRIANNFLKVATDSALQSLVPQITVELEVEVLGHLYDCACAAVREAAVDRLWRKALGGCADSGQFVTTREPPAAACGKCLSVLEDSPCVIAVRLLDVVVDRDFAQREVIAGKTALFQRLLSDSAEVGQAALALARKVPDMPGALDGADFTRPFIVAYGLHLLGPENEALRGRIFGGMQQLIMRVSELEAQVDSLRGDSAALSGRAMMLAHEVDRLGGTVAQLEKDGAALAMENSILEGERSKLDVANQDLGGTVFSLESDNRSLVGQNETLV